MLSLKVLADFFLYFFKIKEKICFVNNTKSDSSDIPITNRVNDVERKHVSKNRKI